MKFSYCTTCYKRLWQLKQTLKHNLDFTISGEVEVCVLVYNDSEAFQYLTENYADYIQDGRLKIKPHFDDLGWNAGRIKNLAHQMATGRVVFNLDADNFIDGVHETLLHLKDTEICITKQNAPNMLDGRIGRIGLTRSRFEKLDGYQENIGDRHDGDLITRALMSGCKIIQSDCIIKPIPNTEEVLCES